MRPGRTSAWTRATLCGLVAGATALGVAACGGSSGTNSAGQAPAAGEGGAGAQMLQVAGTTNRRIATHPGGRAANDPVHPAHRAAHARAQFHGTNDDEVNQSGAKSFSPCRLVTRAEARAIVGKPLRLSVAPQGPTCVYSPRGSKADITLAVERANLAAIRRQSRNLAHVRIHARRGYCVKYGGVKMFVGLGGGRVLSVAAPCQTAARFAATALPRVR
jgi:hypothetical protein